MSRQPRRLGKSGSICMTWNWPAQGFLRRPDAQVYCCFICGLKIQLSPQMILEASTVPFRCGCVFGNHPNKCLAQPMLPYYLRSESKFLYCTTTEKHCRGGWWASVGGPASRPYPVDSTNHGFVGAVPMPPLQILFVEAACNFSRQIGFIGAACITSRPY